MRFLADIPEDQQVANLHKFLTSIGSASTSTKVIDDIITTWYDGEVDRIASFADAYVSFIAVGALHLAGTQSVLADLEKLGYHARRIQ